MLFNSYEFIFLFFPLVLAGLALCRKFEKNFPAAGFCSFRKQEKSFQIGKKSFEKVYLLLASLIFYGWLHPEYLPVLAGSMVINYGLGRLIEKSRREEAMHLKPESAKAMRPGAIPAFGVIFNLTVLCIFKYVDTNGFVPLGISFFTFTQIAYLMECYRENLKGVNALSYGLYVSFFPKMMQGPIALPKELSGQFDDEKRKFEWARLYQNLCLFVLGLAKKVLIADTLGKAVDFGYGNLAALNSGDGLVVMLSYTFQLYFDFSGYCDMAMGIAGMMGFELPLNFDSPYKASNILEFWKRWHITLTGFFTKYLYIPLGGNRKGRIRTCINCLIVFFLSGIWHGAGWQFIVWGMMHGLLFVVTRVWKDMGRDGALRGLSVAKINNKILHAVCVFATFLYVNLAWIFFRAPSVKDGAALIKTITGFSYGRINWELAGCFNMDEFWYVIKVLRLDSWQYAHYILMVLFLLVMFVLVFFTENAVRLSGKVKPGAFSAFLLAVLFIWSVISFSGVSTFLYVNF